MCSCKSNAKAAHVLFTHFTQWEYLGNPQYDTKPKILTLVQSTNLIQIPPVLLGY